MGWKKVSGKAGAVEARPPAFLKQENRWEAQTLGEKDEESGFIQV